MCLIRGIRAVGDKVTLWIRLLQTGSISTHIGHICTLHTWTHTHTHMFNALVNFLRSEVCPGGKITTYSTNKEQMLK